MRLVRFLFLPAAVLLTAAPLASQLIPLGPEFRINSTSLQAAAPPVLALDGAGLLLAVWESPAVQHDLLVRVFRRNGEPVGPETALHAQGYPRSPVAAALSPGQFAVAWEGDFGAVWLRLVDATGSPVGDEMRLNTGNDPAFGVQLASLPAGGLVATWSDRGMQGGSNVWARFFDAEGRPAGNAKAIALFTSSFPGYLANEAVGVLQDGSFLAFWNSYVILGLPFLPRREAVHFTAAGEPLGPPFEVAPGLLATGRAGYSVSLSWHFPEVSPDSGTDAFVAQYDAAGQSLGPLTTIAGGEGTQTERGVGIDESGRILAVWSEHPLFNPSSGGLPQAGLFSPDAVALGSPFAVSAVHKPAAVRVAGKGGDWALGWVASPGAPEAGNLFVRQLTTCVTGGSQLCLADRFRAEVAFQGGPGGHGSGQAVPLTGDTGAFWFFGPENVELVVKAIDGRAVNDHFWIFYGALSNVAYDITVTDVVTGERKVYHNPAGTMASRADTRAFAGGPASSQAPVLAADGVRQQTAPLTPPPCFNGPENLCLGGPYSQFQVEVTWKVPGTGQTGTGKAVPLAGETGYFWFFSSENVELVVKVLDGQAINGKYWVFYGALSDVEYTIKVTDKLSGKVKTYHNPAGTMASRADTSAF